jgi:hypothetical protein
LGGGSPTTNRDATISSRRSKVKKMGRKTRHQIVKIIHIVLKRYNKLNSQARDPNFDEEEEEASQKYL